MGFPRSPRYESPRQRIDARTADARESGLRGVHRDMSGNIMGGTDETGKAVSFPQRSMLPARPKPAAVAPSPMAVPAPLPPVQLGMQPNAQRAALPVPQFQPVPPTAPAPSAPPTVGMTTGNPAVTFPSAGERAASMKAQAAQSLAAGKNAVFAAGRARTVAEQQATAPTGRMGGVVFGEGTAKKEILTPYGTASVTNPVPGMENGRTQIARPVTFPKRGRIVDETGDRTADFAAGGRYSSFPKRRTA